MPNTVESTLPCLSQRSLAAVNASCTSSLVAWSPLGGSPEACGAELSALNIAAARSASASAVSRCSGPADTCSCPALSRAGAVGDGASEGTEPSYSSDSSCTRSSPDCHSPPSLSSLDFAPFSLSVSSSATSDDVDLSSPDVACSWQAAPSALGPAPLEEAPGSAGWSAPRGRTGRGGDGASGSIMVSKILDPGEPYRPLRA